MEYGGDYFRGVFEFPVEGEGVVVTLGIDEYQFLIVDVQDKVAECCGVLIAFICPVDCC